MNNGDLQGLFKKAIIISSVFCIIFFGYYVFFSQNGYSSLQLIPDSISHNIEDNKVSFAYSIASNENSQMKYFTKIMANEIIIHEDTLELDPGEIWQEKVEIGINKSQSYPLKIQIIMEKNNGIESVHFWVKETDE
jgi:hypothetical protein